MIEKKKKKNIGLIILIVLFFIYLVIEISYSRGLIEYENYKKMTLTSEAMQKFEEDVKNGKNININDYIKEEKDYSSKVSKITSRASEKLEDFFTKGIGDFIKMLSKFFA